jgi:FMN reductase
MAERLSIVGIGGTTSPGSSTEQALQIALRAAGAEGAEVTLFDGAALCAKLYRESLVQFAEPPNERIRSC